MEIIKTLIWIVQIISAISVIVLVLLQHGKGADAGATFGSGGTSGSLFGAQGAASFLSHTTAVFAILFFASTFGLVLLSSSGKVGDIGIMSTFSAKASASTPASAVSANSGSSSSAPANAKAPGKNQIPD